jgi:protein CpxP
MIWQFIDDSAGETTMKIFNKTIVIAMALPLVLGSMSAFAGQDHQDHQGRMMKGHHGGMLEQRHKMLNILTPAQKQKFVELKQQRAEKHVMRLDTKNNH